MSRKEKRMLRKRRKFGGIGYVRDSMANTKKEANKRKEKLKKEGWNVRIQPTIKSESHLGKYNVFKRRPKKKKKGKK